MEKIIIAILLSITITNVFAQKENKLRIYGMKSSKVEC